MPNLIQNTKASFLILFALYLLAEIFLCLSISSHQVWWDPYPWTRWDHQQNVSPHNSLKSHMISDFCEEHILELIACKQSSLPTSLGIFLRSSIKESYLFSELCDIHKSNHCNAHQLFQRILFVLVLQYFVTLIYTITNSTVSNTPNLD